LTENRWSIGGGECGPEKVLKEKKKGKKQNIIRVGANETDWFGEYIGKSVFMPD